MQLWSKFNWIFILSVLYLIEKSLWTSQQISLIQNADAVFSVGSTVVSVSKSINIQSFPLDYIENVTHKYKTLIGEGGFGSVYRGTLPDGQEVAVKVRSSTSTQGTREFDNEVDMDRTHVFIFIYRSSKYLLSGYCWDNSVKYIWQVTFIVNVTAKPSISSSAWEPGASFWLLLWKWSTNPRLSIYVQWFSTRSPLWYLLIKNNPTTWISPDSDILSTTGFWTGEAAKRKTLDWPTRLSIALGAARGKWYWGIQNFLLHCLLTYHINVKEPIHLKILNFYVISYNIIYIIL